MKKTFRILPSIIYLLLGPAVLSLAQSNNSSVVLISFDGFRHDYIDKHDLKNFKAFRAAGVSADGLIPCYPSLTFPNHYSIVTGMRPANHGLVDNNFYDSTSNIQYAIGNRDAVADPRYYGGTPLWTLAKNAGMKTASYFWVGSEVSDPTRRPDRYFLHDPSVPFKTRADSVLAWLNKNDKERPRFISVYFGEPDHVSHETGPESPETHAALLKVDSILGYISEGLKKVKAPVNTILVSDHGMASLVVADETYVFLDEVYNIKSPKVKTVVSSTLAHLYIDDKSTLDSMYTFLKSKEDRFKVYRRNSMPTNIAYNHYRVGDLVLVSEPYRYIRYSGRANFNQRVRMGSDFGVHGYDPAVVKEMQGIFLAQGPQIKKGQKLGPVRNIDIYPLIANILGLTIPKIDGDPKALQKIYTGKN